MREWLTALAVVLAGAVLVGGIVRATNPVVPTYGAQYRDDRNVAEILAEVRAIRQILERQQPAERLPASLKALLTQRCAECHSEGKLARNVSIVVLLKDGSLPPFSTTEKRFVLEKINSGSMPKERPPLSEIEKKYLRDQLFPEVQP